MSFAVMMLMALFPGETHAAEIFRCAANGQITYSDRPCSSGQESTLRVNPGSPDASERQAAEERLRRDKERLATLQAQRTADEQALRAEAAQRQRLKKQRAREQRICVRLEQRLMKAREQARGRFGKDRDALLKKVEKLEDDYALQCRMS